MFILKNIDLKLISLIVLSLLFLGLNSIFCKIALVNLYIDAYSFTLFRLLFAAITLVLIFSYKHKKLSFSKKENWISSFMLFLYAICFSYSYLSIDAGFGTLLLFGTVQIIMIFVSFFYKESINIQKIIGVCIALSGLVFLLYPKESFEVSFYYSFLMILSGLAWGVYSILGKSSNDALFNTMDNFIKACFFIILFYIIFQIDNLNITFEGLFFAFISGSLTSAIGYILWYWILPKIQMFTASVIQLFVPLISIVISVIYLDEILSLTLVLSSLLIFTGVILCILRRKTIY